MTITLSQNNTIDYDFIQNLKSTSITLSELKNTIKQIWNLKMQVRKLSSLERKADTRSKIIMGGFIKKAGLDYLYETQTEALYGLLLAGKQQLEQNPTILEEWSKLGTTLTKNQSYT